MNTSYILTHPNVTFKDTIIGRFIWTYSGSTRNRLVDTTGEAGTYDVIPGENPEMVLLDENLLKESIGNDICGRDVSESLSVFVFSLIPPPPIHVHEVIV